MTSLPATTQPWKEYASLAGVALLAHGLVLINDGYYADGWYFNYFAERGDWDRMKAMWYEIGRPLAFWWVYLPFQSYFNIYLFKFLSLLPLVLVSFMQFHFLHRFTPLTRRSAWFVAAFTLCWPFYHMIVWGQYPDHLPPLWFFGGWLLYFMHLEKNENLPLKVASLAILFASYFYQAFLVYHYVIVLVLFAYTMGYPQRPAWPDIKRHLPDFLKTHWAVLLIPLIFFFSKPYLFPVVGRYAGYYGIHLFSIKTLKIFIGGLINTFAGPLIGLGKYYATLPFLFLIIGITFLIYKKKNWDHEYLKFEHFWWFFGLGVLLVASLVFAHAANYKMAKLLSYQARHSRQAGLGASLIGLAAISYLGHRWSHIRWPVQKFFAFVFLSTLIFININIYLTKQAHWAKNQAVIHQLKKLKPLPSVGIYFMTNHLPMGMGVDYHYAEVSMTLNAAWDEHRHIGVPPYLQRNNTKLEIVKRLKNDWLKGMGFKIGVEKYVPGGCLAEIIVYQEENMPEPVVALRYLWRRMLSPETLPELYDRLTSVEIKPLGITTEGTQCKF